MENLLFGETFWQVVKYPIFVLMVLYIIFAVIVVKQTQLMARTLEVGLERPVLIVSMIHLFAAVGLFFFALLIL